MVSYAYRLVLPRAKIKQKTFPDGKGIPEGWKRGTQASGLAGTNGLDLTG